MVRTHGKEELSAFAIRREWGSDNLAPGRAQRRPGYGVRKREIALKGAKLIGIGRMCRNRLFGPFRAMGHSRGCVPRAALRFARGCYV